MKLPAQLDPANVTAIIDSREQNPLCLEPLPTITAGLQTGDYSIAGLESQVAIERKSLTDLVACCGVERDRFTREIMRLQAYRCRALVVESNWAEIEEGGWRSRVTPQSVIGSLLSWQAEGLPIMLCGDHGRAGRMVSRLLYTYARHRWRELRKLAGELKTDASICPIDPVVQGESS